MARNRYTAGEIIGQLRTVEIELTKGPAVVEAWREREIAEQTYYRWEKEYGGLRVDQTNGSAPTTEKVQWLWKMSWHIITEQLRIR
jgi:hypothetical protein